MKYLITYNYDKWNKDNCIDVEIYNTIDEVNNAISCIKLNYDDEFSRNIKVYKAEEIIDEFDTKTRFDAENAN